VSIDYGKCGCYVDDVTIDVNEIDGWDKHVYEFDRYYNKIFANIPLRFSAFTKVEDFIISVAGQVNEYSDTKLLSSAD
jgi:hypothetical protein